MSQSQTVTELITAVRQQLDEANVDTVDNDKLLAALNRAQRAAVNITAKKYEDMFIDYTTITTVAGQSEYDIPQAVYGGRVEYLELVLQQVPYEIRRISYRQGTFYETSSSSGRPLGWAIISNAIKLYPKPTGGLSIRVWFTRQPEQLVTDQGRITAISTGSNYVTVDTVGSDLSVSSDSLNNYVNIVDPQTGEVKTTLQIASISGSRVTFRTSPIRSTVFNKTVASAIPSTVALDDYICVARGTCVSELYDAYVDFLVGYAAMELKRTMGDTTQEDYVALDKLEKEVERIWVGRENTMRIKKASRRWNPAGRMRKWFYTT